MNTDARVAITFRTHVKRKRLQRKLGHAGPLALLDLWLWAAEHRPTGDFTGLLKEEIAEAAGWPERRADRLIATLLEPDTRFLDQDAAGNLRLHDWERHNSYALRAPERSERARKGAAAKWAKRDAASTTPGNATSTAPSTPGSNAQSNAPVPSPSPTPSPTPKNSEGAASGPPRSLRDWLVATWSEAHEGKKPAWNSKHWIQHAKLYALQGETEIRQRWPRFLADPDPFFAGHPLAVFCSQFDRWIEEAPRGKGAPIEFPDQPQEIPQELLADELVRLEQLARPHAGQLRRMAEIRLVLERDIPRLVNQ